MSLEWKTVELKSIANVTMGQSPKSEFYNDNFEGMPFLQGNKTFGDKYPSFELYTTSIKKVAEKNSVLMSVRAPVGDLNIAQEDICIGRGVCGLQMKKGDNEFLYYLLKANISHLINKESGTVFGSINKNDIETFEVTLPKSSDDQMKILTILKNIDKKIDICKNLNRNLTKLIDTNFKNYLLNFENYSEDDLVSSEFGPIPKEWVVNNLTGIANYQNGLAMQKFPPETPEDSFKVLKIKELRQGFFDESSDLCSKNIKEECIVYDGDVIFSWSGSLLVDIWTGGTCGLNQHLFKVTSSNFDKWFYYCWTKFYLDQFILIAKDKATTMGHIKRQHLEESLVLIPDEETYNNLTNLFKPLFEYLTKNKIEIKKLQSLRDTLLPKLMSGKIDVSKINCDMQQISTNNWDNKFTVPLQNNLITVIS